MSTNPKLLEAWKQRTKKIAEGNKFHAEGNKLFEKSIEFNGEGIKLYAEGEKNWVQSDICRAEADLLWINAVIEVYGKDMTIEWKNRVDRDNQYCILGNGEVYTVEMSKE